MQRSRAVHNLSAVQQGAEPNYISSSHEDQLRAKLVRTGQLHQSKPIKIPASPAKKALKLNFFGILSPSSSPESSPTQSAKKTPDACFSISYSPDTKSKSDDGTIASPKMYPTKYERFWK